MSNVTYTIGKKNNLRIGDTIKCANCDDMVNTMIEIEKVGIDTDFLYEKNGEKGLWIEVKGVDSDELMSNVVHPAHYPMCRKTPCFSYGDIRHFHRIYASN